ncbi:MAG: type II toxin-antitoxin system HicB family antitoxin [Patescibacteria group bacterium]|nr:type II toxin-antitoxin system HicB family antitoxin [Patescibacteria group bacterium]
MLTFKIEKDQDKWHAYCPELSGCHTFGNTPEEAMKNLKNAVNLYIEDEIEYQGFQGVIDHNEQHFTYA